MEIHFGGGGGSGAGRISQRVVGLLKIEDADYTFFRSMDNDLPGYTAFYNRCFETFY